MAADQSTLDEEREDSFLEMSEDEKVWTSWTAQQERGIPDISTDPALEPVQYAQEQLPLIEGHVPENLVLDEGEEHPNGPEPGELLTMGKIEAMPERETVETFNTQDVLPDNWTVQGGEVIAGAEPASDEGDEVNLDSMTKSQIQAWADANGYEGLVDKDTMTKDEMIEALTT